MSAANKTLNVADKAATGLARWVTSDHSTQTNHGRTFDHVPSTGFLGSFRYALTQLVIGVLGALLSGIFVFILIAYGIPLLITIFL
jgi:hypothetical protein